LAGFSGIDFPEKISSPVRELKSILGVLAVASIYIFLGSTYKCALKCFK
jgi:hypothetical protein